MQIYCITLQLQQHWQFSWRQPPLKISDLSAERMEGRQMERYDRISRRRRLALSRNLRRCASGKSGCGEEDQFQPLNATSEPAVIE
jgi:hypothetical protein